MSSSPSSSSPSLSLKIQPLTSQNRPGVAGLVFDSHMKSVTPMYLFMRRSPLTLVVWTALSTVILKYRQTTFRNISEILLVFSVSYLLSQAVLFLTFLYEASTQAPGIGVVGKLDMFVNQDQDRNQVGATAAPAAATTTGASTGATAGNNNSSSSSSSTVTKRTTTTPEVPFLKKEDNLFWVLEKGGLPIGSIGATVDKTKDEARLECWVVQEAHQRNGCGTLLLKTAMDQLSEKKTKVKTVRVVLQGYQIPALRLFYKFKFQQIDRTPEWLGERVVLEIATKDWVKDQKK